MHTRYVSTSDGKILNRVQRISCGSVLFSGARLDLDNPNHCWRYFTHLPYHTSIVARIPSFASFHYSYMHLAISFKTAAADAFCIAAQIC